MWRSSEEARNPAELKEFRTIGQKESERMPEEFDSSFEESERRVLKSLKDVLKSITEV